MRKAWIKPILGLNVAVLLIAGIVFEISRGLSPRDVRERFRSANLTVLDRNGQIIDELAPDAGLARRLPWVKLSLLPRPLIQAVLAAEDSWFFYRPLSPLTRKTLALIDELNGTKSNDRFGFFRALALEIKWGKSEILEAYLNLIHFRGNLQGVNAASFGLFDIAPMELSFADSALLAALARTPNVSLARIRPAACEILRKVGAPEECGMLTPSHLAYLDRVHGVRPFTRLAPHVAQILGASPEAQGKAVIRSTLDRRLQWTALHALQIHGHGQGAAVVLDNRSAEVLAYVGSLGPAHSSPDLAVTEHAAGPTLIPLIFAKAIDERILTAASLLPTDLRRGFKGLVSSRTAVSEGLNIPTVRALELLGSENFAGTMGDLGFSGLGREDSYGPSLAAGTVGVRVVDVANAYRTVANDGEWTELSFSAEIPGTRGAHGVFSRETAFVIKDILGRAAGPMGKADSPNRWMAVATGACAEWCVGFSEKYTVAVWTDDAVSKTIWREIMAELHRVEQSEEPTPPKDLARAPDGGRLEWFLAGTEPGSAAAASSRISYPQREGTYSLSSLRRIFIQVTAPRSDQNLYLNQRRIARAQARVPWGLKEGRHVLDLRDSKGTLLDRVIFHVVRTSSVPASL